MESAPALDACQLIWGTKMGEWLAVFPYTVKWMHMVAQEYRNALFICHEIDLLDLPPHWDGWNAKTSICHALDCKKNGFIKTIHNELCDGVAEFSGKYFTLLYVRDNPRIHPGHAVWEGKAQTGVPSQKFTSLCQRDTDSIHNMCVVSTENLFHQNNYPNNCLQMEDKEKKKTNMESCLQEHCHLSPIVVSVDGLLSLEGGYMLKCIARHLE